MFWSLVACAAPLSGPVVLDDVRMIDGARVSLEIRDGRFVTVGRVPPSAVPRVDMRGVTVVPAFIDSHVHLAYWAVAREHAEGGIAAAVDLAAPLGSVGRGEPGGPRVVWSGPMITVNGGYPTTSWGAGGYGLEVADADAAADAVERLYRAGARIIKVPVEAGGLSDAILARIVAEAHARKLLVVAHALSDADTRRAASAGIDGLAHTPIEPLSEETIAAWADPQRFVISTLRAFGSLSAPGNLRALRAAGTTILYGTDLGNTRTTGIDGTEIALLVAAGLDGAAIVDAATRVPAERFGWSDLGQIAVGYEASFLLIDGDPLADPSLLAHPKEVWIAGVRR